MSDMFTHGHMLDQVCSKFQFDDVFLCISMKYPRMFCDRLSSRHILMFLFCEHSEICFIFRLSHVTLCVTSQVTLCVTPPLP